MPDSPKTPQRAVRLDDQLWRELGELAGDRSAVIRQLLEWWLRKPGAKLPPRPDAR